LVETLGIIKSKDDCFLNRAKDGLCFLVALVVDAKEACDDENDGLLTDGEFCVDI
jgi:hypothetical protein